ncbi:unnamed protein product [Ilex paraguariensis]|uniref:Uncharacterized protein n=1 Tax=Ilex paraguariensis TaxID=185542 RepID=A0ABC8SQG0_9AQUA
MDPLVVSIILRANWDLNRRISPIVQQSRKKKRVSSSADLAVMNRRGSRGYLDRCVVSPRAKVAVCSHRRPKLRLPSYPDIWATASVIWACRPHNSKTNFDWVNLINNL